MFDISSLEPKELVELKKKIDLTLLEKMKDDDSFYSKIMKLKDQLSSFVGKSISISIDGCDIFINFRFENGINFVFDELDYSQLSIDEYNTEGFERLYIESLEKESEVDNLYILLDNNFVATSNINAIEDRFGYGFKENKDIIFIIRTDTVDCVFEIDQD